eukprot:g12581.t1
MSSYALTWDLDVLLPHPETGDYRRVVDEFTADLKALAERSDALPAISANADTVEMWATFLAEYESIDARANDLTSFIGCHAAAEAGNKVFQKYEAEDATLQPYRSRIATNVEFALKETDNDTLAAFIAADERLGRIAFFLNDCRSNAELRLPKELEFLAADLGVDGIHAWGRLYDRVSGALRIRVMEKGEIVEKSPSQVQFDSDQRAVRENNFYAADKAWAGIADSCADALNHISGTRLTIYKRLGLQDHLDAPLKYNRMSRETLDAMWGAVSDRKSSLSPYLDAKAKLLGLEKLSWYDLTAPLPKFGADSASAEISYDDACNIVIDTFNGFSPDFGKFAKQAIDDRWIEVENRPGKRQGGFCTGFPTKQQSRIFMTYTNSRDSMSTLAHELGHAYHSHVLRDQPLFLQDYPMNLAETASTFAEAVLGEQQLNASTSTAEQMQILDVMLGDSVAFLMNIHARFIFENEFHRERAAGELSPERFSELMLAAQKEAYLDGLADDGWNPNFWISKLHFYISGLPFYNFPYTFGYLLSLGVYALAGEAGDDFPAQYRRLLIATGCETTEDAVRSTIGADLTQKDFWNKSLDIVEQRVARFVELAQTRCEHMGAAASLILEEKTQLGLAEAPPESVPTETLSEDELLRQALAEREERAAKERFRLESSNTKQPWTDYVVTSSGSGKTYRVALRGEQRGDSYCSCPDFRTNTLGTCKHIIYAQNRVRKKFPAAKRSRRFRNREIFVHVLYGETLELYLRLPDRADDEIRSIAGKIADKPITNVRKLIRCVKQLESAGHSVTIYPDAEEFIDRAFFQLRLSELVEKIRENPEAHPLRKNLLKTELLPYQLDGIAFAAGVGRAVLADDMGLGKTIQGIGVAELLAREAQIHRVLVICPASLKSQWKSEVERFSNRDVQLVLGSGEERAAQYENNSFFTVCNYEQVLRDLPAIERAQWDLIILDEGQRIKNWEAKTSRMVKALRSPFALVLSGTPLENRLDELYSVVQFIDDRRLGPAFRFFHRHRVVDDNGKVTGYKNLDKLRRNLAPVLLRRTRQSVLSELPPRSTEIVRFPATAEQADIHRGHMRTVSSIAGKPYISEMDLLRLQRALLMCRMVANSTFLVDKQEPSYSSKLERLAELLSDLLNEPDRKLVLFSEWTTMLDLIEPLLGDTGFVRLDGKVPQKKRQRLVHDFQNKKDCRLFLATNAGSTGLNLQAANTIVNVDLPWNPAVLEQRIARAHRMGQKRPVQVFVLVTEETIEENLLVTLSAKRDLAMAALDADSDVSEVDFPSSMEELRRRLELLLGAKPDSPIDESVHEQVSSETTELTEHRERVAAAGGELLGAAFKFLGQLVSDQSTADSDNPLAGRMREQLAACVIPDDQGRQKLTVTLPDQSALDSLAETMARLLAAGNGRAE